MIVTATVVQNWAVRLEATENVGTVHWYRDYASQVEYLGDGPALIDHTPPLNETINYYAQDDSDTAYANGIVVESDYPILTSTMHGDAVEVTVLDQPPLEWTGRSVAHPILNDPEPRVSVAPASFPRGTLVLYMRSRQERQVLMRMLVMGDPLSLRSTCLEAVDTVVFLPEAWRDPLASESNKAGPRHLEIDFQAVQQAPESYPPPVLRDYGDILAEGAYQWHFDTWADYREMRAGA